MLKRPSLSILTYFSKAVKLYTQVTGGMQTDSTVSSVCYPHFTNTR